MTHTFFTKRIFFHATSSRSHSDYRAIGLCDDHTDRSERRPETHGHSRGAGLSLGLSRRRLRPKAVSSFSGSSSIRPRKPSAVFFLGDVKKYDAVIFNASQVVAPITGRYTKLKLVDSNGERSRQSSMTSWIPGSFSELRGTSVHKTNHLVRSAHNRLPDHSDTKIYATSNGDLYALIISGGTRTPWMMPCATAKLQDVTALGPNPVNCGRLVDLKDLLLRM